MGRSLLNIFSEIALPVVLGIIMFSMGLDLTLRDFTRIAREPLSVGGGLFAQLISLPLIGFAFASLWPGLSPEARVGVMIIAACPGGAMSNMLTYLARGELALSVTLTAIVSIVTLISLPIITNFALDHFMGADAVPLPLVETVLALTAITMIPVALGMVVRAKAADMAARIEGPFKAAALILFILMVAAATFQSQALLQAHLSKLAPLVFVMCPVVMLIAWGWAKLLRRNRPITITFTIECGIQNGTLAMLIAGTFIGNQSMMLPGAAYGLLMFVPAAIFVAWVRKNKSAHPDGSRDLVSAE